MAAPEETLNTFRGLLNLPDATEDEILRHLALIGRAGYRLVTAESLLAEMEAALAESISALHARLIRFCVDVGVVFGAPDDAEIRSWLEREAAR